MRSTKNVPRSSETPQLLAIGEVSELTGVTTSTLRYYDELSLVRPVARVVGRRRYAASAVRYVGLIVVLREIGFSLAETKRFIAGERRSRRKLINRKLNELVEQQQRIQVARSALEHGLDCPAVDQMECPRFWSIIERRQLGLSLGESHARAH